VAGATRRPRLAPAAPFKRHTSYGLETNKRHCTPSRLKTEHYRPDCSKLWATVVILEPAKHQQGSILRRIRLHILDTLPPVAKRTKTRSTPPESRNRRPKEKVRGRSARVVVCCRLLSPVGFASWHPRSEKAAPASHLCPKSSPCEIYSMLRNNISSSRKKPS
jgi:hypothetical protein